MGKTFPFQRCPSKAVAVKLSERTSLVCLESTTKRTTVYKALCSDPIQRSRSFDGQGLNGSYLPLTSSCAHFSSNSSIPLLNIHSAANDILHGLPYFLPTYMVPSLGTSRRRASRKPRRTHRVYHRRFFGNRDVLNRLGWYPSQQPKFPCLVHLPVMDLLRLSRYSRLHLLQEAHFQLGREDQQSVVARHWRCRSIGDPGSARVLRIFQSLRVGYGLPILLCEERSSRLQGSLHEV